MALSHFDSELFAPFLYGAGYHPQSGAMTHRTPEASVRGIPLDVIERADRFEIKADIPGQDKKDIKLSVDGDVLSLSVQRSQSKEDGKEEAGVKVHRAERSFTFVRRSLRLPEYADLSKIKASYDNGVLHVQVPKADQTERSRVVAIE